MSMVQKIVLYESLDPKQKNLDMLRDKLNLEAIGAELVNVYDDEATLAEIDSDYRDIHVYCMGEVECPWNRAEIVGVGPGYGDLRDVEARKTLSTAFNPVESNPFAKHLLTKMKKGSQVKSNEKPAIPVSSEPFPQDIELESLEGNIDNALYAIERLRQRGVTIELHDADMFVGPKRTKDMMSYEDLTALLLLFKSVGAQKLYYRSKIFFTEEQVEEEGDDK